MDLNIPLKSRVSPGLEFERFVYGYLVYGETITLIDTGVAGCEMKIFDAIRSAGRDPSEIALIVLTHSHPDHIGAAMVIQRETGCSIAAHPSERAWIENVDLQNRQRPVPGFASLVSGSVKVDREFIDGDLIVPDECRDRIMTVLHTPGHSPGSISLFMQNEGVLFSGDVIPVIGDLPVYDGIIASVQSIKRLQGLSGIRVLLPAWDKPGDGHEAYGQMGLSIQYLQTIYGAVLGSSDKRITDLLELTRETAAFLGHPLQAVNSLLARTFAANPRVQNQKNLLENFR